MSSDLDKVASLRWILRATYGLIPIAAGADKFFNILTNWEQYVSPSVAQMLPFSTAAFMHVVGIIEIIAGIIVLGGWTVVGGYLVCGWLTLVGLSLVYSGQYLDVAVRDIAMAVGAYTLGVLSEAFEESRSRQTNGERRISASA